MNYVLFGIALIVLAVMAVKGYNKYKKLYTPRIEMIIGGIGLVALIASLFLPCLLFSEEDTNNMVTTPPKAPTKRFALIEPKEIEAKGVWVEFDASPTKTKETCETNKECLEVEAITSNSPEILVGKKYVLVGDSLPVTAEYSYLEIIGNKIGEKIYTNKGEINSLIEVIEYDLEYE